MQTSHVALYHYNKFDFLKQLFVANFILLQKHKNTEVVMGKDKLPQYGVNIVAMNPNC